MSFNDLVKKEAADKKASQAKTPKLQSATEQGSASESKSADPSTD